MFRQKPQQRGGAAQAGRKSISLFTIACSVLVIIIIAGVIRFISIAGGEQTQQAGNAAGGSASQPQQQGGAEIEGSAAAGDELLPHLHGMGYSADGQQLIVAAHNGLRLYAEGAWSTPDVPAHDYMGFSPTDSGFYSSGHPLPQSGLSNPLGLVKSSDGGESLTTLGFEGQSDFHVMGVGYQSHAIYVLNETANAKLDAGLYYSLDDGETWQQSALDGISGHPLQLAVHPTDAAIVAFVTEDGMFLSQDHGATVKRIGEQGMITAVTFDPTGKRLLFGAKQLAAYTLATEQVSPLQAPQMMSTEDAVSHIAVNPARPEQLAVATFGRDIYLSADSGQSWRPIARKGQAVAR